MRSGIVAMATAFLIASSSARAFAFDYKDEILGGGNTDLAANVSSVSPGGAVTVNGADTQPLNGFSFDWGDGTVTTGYFPASHSYTDTARNYVVTVTALHTDGSRPTVQASVWLQAPVLTNPPLPSGVEVTIPNSTVVLTAGASGPLTGLSFFGDSYFTTFPRATIEGVLTLGAGVESDLANHDQLTSNGRFDQVVVRDPSHDFGSSLWYTTPVALALGSGYLTGSIDWVSLFHEMGHNVTLNFPSSFIFGGKIDGNANAIYSETMAQIFSFATIYEMVNNNASYGISDELALDLGTRGKNAVKLLKTEYDHYLSSGMPFTSWNDPAVSGDETFTTFMTLAYKFMYHAESDGMGYRLPLQRMTQLLGRFDQTMLDKYDPANNSVSGATFRSTLMVAAISNAFQKDLRDEFRALNFPVDDQEFSTLIASAGTVFPTFADVASSSIYFPYVEAIAKAGITKGCGNGNYCPSEKVTRGQMAAFIERSLLGENFTYNPTPYFDDVLGSNVYFKYVQRLKDDAITAVTGSYDVDGFVTRGQMAAFLTRAKYGESFGYTPQAYFLDVPAGSTFYKYVQKLKDSGITAATGSYDVDSYVTREQMAAFLSRAFLGMH